MKLTLILLTALFGFQTTGWLNNFEEAQKTAKVKHQLILLNFSGSDWCVPCIKLKKEIFESTAFQQYADTSLVLVNADFPRKKGTISKEQVKINEALADKYNKDGKFPLSILMTDDGKILKQWEGCPNISPDAFIGIVESIKYDNKY